MRTMRKIEIVKEGKEDERMVSHKTTLQINRFYIRHITKINRKEERKKDLFDRIVNECMTLSQFK